MERKWKEKEAYKAPVRKPANFMCSNRSYSGMKTVRGIETGADENRTEKTERRSETVMRFSIRFSRILQSAGKIPNFILFWIFGFQPNRPNTWPIRPSLAYKQAQH
jgi:hypothetical protein